MKKAKQVFLDAYAINKEKKFVISALVLAGYSEKSAKWYYYKLIKLVTNETN